MQKQPSQHRLQQLLGPSAKHPIVVPPMANASNAALVLAAARAGCLAFLAAGYASVAQLCTEINDLISLSKSESLSPSDSGCAVGIPLLWGVGFLTWRLDQSDEGDTLLSEVTPITCFKLKSYQSFDRVKIFLQVQTVSEAIKYADLADVIVIQGREAGGHGVGDTGSTFTMLPEVVAAVQKKAIILAAGGIVTGGQAAAAILLGADGVVMGTRFVASNESAFHPIAKRRILAAKEGGNSTIRTRIYNTLRAQDWPQRYDFRILANSATNAFVENPQSLQTSLLAQFNAASNSTEKQDSDFDMIAIACGEGVGLINDISSVEKIVAKVVSDLETFGM
ncbi:hypothetical protein HK100_002850 [Physocladia obscura]|uniref:Nitronate monooxygenase domain-containing protein n=1 Tax=Physocladia obscura TaxID=109957 RepID=A0AAD5T0T6_9FUNG|nr:hypothetical protein HK100_002850 [Physocladia obscura]